MKESVARARRKMVGLYMVDWTWESVCTVLRINESEVLTDRVLKSA